MKDHRIPPLLVWLFTCPYFDLVSSSTSYTYHWLPVEVAVSRGDTRGDLKSIDEREKTKRHWHRFLNFTNRWQNKWTKENWINKKQTFPFFSSLQVIVQWAQHSRRTQGWQRIGAQPMPRSLCHVSMCRPWGSCCWVSVTNWDTV